MRKALVLILAFALLTLGGCGSQSSTTNTTTTNPVIPAVPEEKVSWEESNSYYTDYETPWSHYIRGYLEITNTGDLPVYLEDCSFTLTDDSGNVLGLDDTKAAYPDVVYPGNRGYFECRVDLDGVDTSNGANISAQYTISEATNEVQVYPITDVTFNKSTDTFYGKIENPYDKMGATEVKVFLYDKDKNLIGLYATNEMPKANSTEAFDMWLTAPFFDSTTTVDDVDSYEFVAQGWYFQF